MIFIRFLTLECRSLFFLLIWSYSLFPFFSPAAGSLRERKKCDIIFCKISFQILSLISCPIRPAPAPSAGAARGGGPHPGSGRDPAGPAQNWPLDPGPEPWWSAWRQLRWGQLSGPPRVASHGRAGRYRSGRAGRCD